MTVKVIFTDKNTGQLLPQEFMYSLDKNGVLWQLDFPTTDSSTYPTQIWRGSGTRVTVDWDITIETS